MIESIDQFTFVEKVTNSDVPVIVDFWAEWCSPCKMMVPILEKIADERSNKVKILKMNTDENVSFSLAANLRSIPTFILYVGGVEMKRVSGARTEKMFIKEFAEWIE